MKILIVDDEVKIANVLSERFRLRGIDAIPVYDGKSALDLVKKDSFDGIVLDLRLPDIDGKEVLKQIRKEFQHIDVVILSGHANDQEFKKCMQMGAIVCFHKPANIQEIAEVFLKSGKVSDEHNK
ncbi:response regulator [Thermodesulfobacteriota bacterium]